MAEIYPNVSTNNEVPFPSSTIIYQLSLAGNSQLIWSKADKLWEVIKNSIVAYIVRSISNTKVYIIIVHYFCGRLQLIVRKLSVEKLLATDRVTILFFFATLPKNDQNILNKVLKLVWD